MQRPPNCACGHVFSLMAVSGTPYYLSVHEKSREHVAWISRCERRSYLEANPHPQPPSRASAQSMGFMKLFKPTGETATAATASAVPAPTGVPSAVAPAPSAALAPAVVIAPAEIFTAAYGVDLTVAPSAAAAVTTLPLAGLPAASSTVAPDTCPAVVLKHPAITGISLVARFNWREPFFLHFPFARMSEVKMKRVTISSGGILISNDCKGWSHSSLSYIGGTAQRRIHICA